MLASVRCLESRRKPLKVVQKTQASDFPNPRFNNPEKITARKSRPCSISLERFAGFNKQMFTHRARPVPQSSCRRRNDFAFWQ